MNRSEAVPIISSPIKDESLIGYLIRIAGLNAYESSAWPLRHVGLSYAKTKASTWRSKLPELASILGQPLEAISNLAPLNTFEGNHSKVTLLNGEAVSRYFLKWPTKAICSLCARENGYLSSLWDLRFVTHCPRHGCKLRDACSECGKVVRFYRTSIDFCECLSAKAGGDSSISEAHIGLLRLLSNKYSGTKFDLARFGFPELIQRASCREVLETIALLGTSLHREGDPDGRGYLRVSEANTIIHVSDAAGALANWPEGFIRFIGKMIAPTDWYLENEFFAFGLERLYRTCSTQKERFPTVYEGFEAYLRLVSEGRAPYIHNTVVPSPGRHQWLVSSSDARNWLKVSRAGIDRLIRKGLLQTITIRRGRRVDRLVTHESLEAYNDLKKRLIGIGAAAYMLSISLYTLKELVRAGFVTPVHSPDLDGNHCWRFDQKVLEGFLYELEVHADISKIRPVQLIAAVKKYNKQGLSYVRLLEMIREGEVELLMYSQTERGFLKFGVDPEVLHKLFNDEGGLGRANLTTVRQRRTGLVNG